MSDYPAYGELKSVIVLRVEGEGSGSKYEHRYLNFLIGSPGGEYDSLVDARRATLTRQQVVELSQQLAAWLGGLDL